MNFDVRISDHGSIVLLSPMSDHGRAWLEANIDQNAQTFGGGVVVEPRYMNDILQGMQDDDITFSSIF